MGQNFHAKNQENPWSGFQEKLATNQLTTNGSDLMGPGNMVARRSNKMVHARLTFLQIELINKQGKTFLIKTEE